MALEVNTPQFSGCFERSLGLITMGFRGIAALTDLGNQVGDGAMLQPLECCVRRHELRATRTHVFTVLPSYLKGIPSRVCAAVGAAPGCEPWPTLDYIRVDTPVAELVPPGR